MENAALIDTKQIQFAIVILFAYMNGHAIYKDRSCRKCSTFSEHIQSRIISHNCNISALKLIIRSYKNFIPRYQWKLASFIKNTITNASISVQVLSLRPPRSVQNLYHLELLPTVELKPKVSKIISEIVMRTTNEKTAEKHHAILRV